MGLRKLRISLVAALSLMMVGSALLAAPASAQTPFVPYFGKNQIRFFNFEWKIYQTEHFEIFYYGAIAPHLERVAGYAEDAYLHISTELKHEIPERIPLILFKTQSEFQTNNVFSGVPEGVLAFTEPSRRRMVVPIDEPPDQLYRLITHELTHDFEFDMIPRGILGASVPLWVDEGLADYMAGYWNVLDLMMVRDAALSDNVPRMSNFEAEPLSGRLPYAMGHAGFEFIEARWGKTGVNQFLFSLRKSAVGSGQSAYKEALKVDPEEFDDMFDSYLKNRFRFFRDKERPNEYGHNLAPQQARTHFSQVLSIETSPSGDMMACVVANSRDYELDIALVSAKNGDLVKNLTGGFDHTHRIEYIATAGGLRGNLVPWIAWSPVGDMIAYFARTGKVKSLIIMNVATGKYAKRVPLETVDAPESPTFSPDGKRVAFAAIQNGITDIYSLDLATDKLTNLTKDDIADFSPAYSPDGRTLVYAGRVNSNDKLFQLDLVTGEKKQLTFGTHDDASPKFFNANMLVFTSMAIDPKVSIPPEVARNANIPNVWTLDLHNGQLQQLTDTMSGNISPAVVHGSDALRVAFISFYKGQERVEIISGDRVVTTVASSDFGEAAPIVPFTPEMGHTLVPENIHKKGRFENLTMAGAPPIGVGVTSSGNIYGNTQITFTDLLGDQVFSFFVQSVSQYRTFSFEYLSIEHRLQYALQAFSQDLYYFGQNPALYDPALAPFITHDQADAVQGQRGATGFLIYPFNKYTRAEMFGGYMRVNERYVDPALQQAAAQYQIDQYGSTVFRNGNVLPLGISLVRETTIFREYGPVSGNTFKLTFSTSPQFNNNWLGKQTIDVDLRHYQRLVNNGVLAMRLKGFRSWGPTPDFLYFGGNSEMRGYEYLQFIGHKAFFTDVELRYPLAEAILTPFGVIGGLRGVVFFNLGGSGFNNANFNAFETGSAELPLLLGFASFNGNAIPIYSENTVHVSGFRLVDSFASYGLGLQTQILGFPIHFDWAWKTKFNRNYEDIIYFYNASLIDPSGRLSGSQLFRKVKFQFWIGYDF